MQPCVSLTHTHSVLCVCVSAEECPCQNGGMCVDSDGTCDCPSGYTGLYCQFGEYCTLKHHHNAAESLKSHTSILQTLQSEVFSVGLSGGEPISVSLTVTKEGSGCC